ncbi:MAG: hypothetical protein EPN60_09705 [Nevskiaceae bacterium]|nr:MAG: hypothetical protein EPN60_09705 [Nevskiaceae bacterium]
MPFLRALVIWMLALSLPIEGMASAAMAQCKDMQSSSAAPTASMPASHDHAAMMAMASMDAPDSMAPMNHAKPSNSADSEKDLGASSVGCKCGCKCSGDCAVSCAGMMISFPQSGLSFAGISVALPVAMPRGQARAAYRYEPLRPPSAVAL